MDGAELIRRMWAHAAWADAALLEALTRGSNVPAEAWREYAHVIAAEAVWLARLEQRPAPVPVWPTLSPNEVAALRASVVTGYDAYLARLDAASLLGSFTYRNSTGQEFTSVVHDVLVHVALHGHYHRGKLNLLLRQGHCEPGPVDYIGFVRGVPAAVTPSGPASPQTRQAGGSLSSARRAP